MLAALISLRHLLASTKLELLRLERELARLQEQELIPVQARLGVDALKDLQKGERLVDEMINDHEQSLKAAARKAEKAAGKGVGEAAAGVADGEAV